MTAANSPDYRLGIAVQRLIARVDRVEGGVKALENADDSAPQHTISKTLAYDGSDRLSVVTDARGTKTMTYDGSDKLTAIAGTGEYPDMTFTYSGDQLTAVTVT